MIIKDDNELRRVTKKNLENGIRPMFAYTCAEYHGDFVVWVSNNEKKLFFLYF